MGGAGYTRSVSRRSTRLSAWLAFGCLAWAANAQHAGAQVLELGYTPVARAQVAIWIEDSAGTYLATVALTEAVAYRGIGNRPGASQMNSGYRWPYGRREGALPIWAHRRASAPGATLFPRVIFQSRPEGFASRLINDQSPDAYHCLQFDPSHATRDELDAVSCATKFSSDKGRYLTEGEARMGYGEPWEEGGAAAMRSIPLMSVYPPRMDVVRCTADTCFDHADVDNFARDARAVMPEIDAVTRATAPGGMPQKLLFSVPASWAPGAYTAWIEINVEGDYNENWNEMRFPTPRIPASAWDMYAKDYGYPYRGQPSVAYSVPFQLGDPARTSFSASAPAGRSTWAHWSSTYGSLDPISMAPDDPFGMTDAAGSGAGRLEPDAAGNRFTVQVREGTLEPPPPVVRPGAEAGAGSVPVNAAAPAVGGVSNLTLRHHDNQLRAHTWVLMSFLAARSEMPIHAYEVRVSTEPMADETAFIRNGRPAKNATDDSEGASALMLPVDVPEGSMIATAIGDLVAETHYYVGVRAVDERNRPGPISVAEIDMPARTFATVSACFIASAAYGTPLAQEVAVLRRLRDRYLMGHAPGRALVAGYYAIGPQIAALVARNAPLRSLVRSALTPLVAAAHLALDSR